MGGGAAAMKRSARARLDEEDRDNDRLSTHDQECQAGIEAKALGRATRKTYTKKLTRTSLTSQALSGMGNPDSEMGERPEASLERATEVDLPVQDGRVICQVFARGYPDRHSCDGLHRGRDRRLQPSDKVAQRRQSPQSGIGDDPLAGVVGIMFFWRAKKLAKVGGFRQNRLPSYYGG